VIESRNGVPVGAPFCFWKNFGFFFIFCGSLPKNLSKNNGVILFFEFFYDIIWSWEHFKISVPTERGVE